MFDLDSLKLFLVISIALSSITCAVIQKTKILFKNSKYIVYYSLIINLLTSILFCKTFTSISFPKSLWIGLFSFIGADSIYKSLEGKISSYNDILTRKKIENKEKNIINKEDK